MIREAREAHEKAIAEVKMATYNLINHYTIGLFERPVLNWVYMISSFCRENSETTIGWILNSRHLVRDVIPDFDKDERFKHVLEHLGSILDVYDFHCRYNSPIDFHRRKFIDRVRLYTRIINDLMIECKEPLSYWKRVVDKFEKDIKEYIGTVFGRGEEFFLEIVAEARECIQKMQPTPGTIFLHCCGKRKDLYKIVRYLKPNIYKKV